MRASLTARLSPERTVFVQLESDGRAEAEAMLALYDLVRSHRRSPAHLSATIVPPGETALTVSFELPDGAEIPDLFAAAGRPLEARAELRPSQDARRGRVPASGPLAPIADVLSAETLRAAAAIAALTHGPDGDDMTGSAYRRALHGRLDDLARALGYDVRGIDRG